MAVGHVQIACDGEVSIGPAPASPRNQDKLPCPALLLLRRLHLIHVAMFAPGVLAMNDGTYVSHFAMRTVLALALFQSLERQHHLIVETRHSGHAGDRGDPHSTTVSPTFRWLRWMLKPQVYGERIAIDNWDVVRIQTERLKSVARWPLVRILLVLASPQWYAWAALTRGSQ